jgi:Ca2+-binding RTX toxin-like protein
MQILPPLPGSGTGRRYRGAVPRPAVRTLVVACLVTFLVAGLVGPASAATCTFDAATRSATVTVGNGESVTIGRSGPAITLDGTPCDAATVTTTDTIVVTATGIPTQIAIDLSGGPFEPGATTESDASSEIEFTVDVPAGTPTLRIVGSATADTIIAGVGGINLNGAETNGDADVLITGNPTSVIAGGDGDDALSVAGGSGTGQPAAAGSLFGDAGADRLRGATGGSSFDGAAGTDTLDYGAATGLTLADLTAGHVDHQGGGTDDVTDIENLIGSPGDDLIAGDAGANALDGAAGGDRLDGGGGDDDLDGGDGNDTVAMTSAETASVHLGSGVAVGEGTDALAAIENVVGSPGNDRLVGDGGANELRGTAGEDRLVGGGGDDMLDGGDGEDRASYRRADAAVAVNLGKGTAEGDGTDTLVDVENVDGSKFGDELHGDGSTNDLDGRAGPDRVFGRSGDDSILGRGGDDLLFGQNGDDFLRAGKGKDQLDGGAGDDVCKGGDEADSFVFCENFPTVRVPAGVWYREPS